MSRHGFIDALEERIYELRSQRKTPVRIRLPPDLYQDMTEFASDISTTGGNMRGGNINYLGLIVERDPFIQQPRVDYDNDYEDHQKIESPSITVEFGKRRFQDYKEFTPTLVGAIESGYFGEDAELLIERKGEDMYLRMVQHVYQEMMDERTIEYPATWWDHVKERFAPDWFLERWPVEYREVTMRAVAYYPKVSLPDVEHTLSVEVSRDAI